MAAKLSESDRDRAAQVVAIFSVLLHAWHTNDFSEAARTCDELNRLGVKVQLPRRHLAGEEVADGR